MVYHTAMCNRATVATVNYDSTWASLDMNGVKERDTSWVLHVNVIPPSLELNRVLLYIFNYCCSLSCCEICLTLVMTKLVLFDLVLWWMVSSVIYFHFKHNQLLMNVHVFVCFDPMWWETRPSCVSNQILINSRILFVLFIKI